MTEPTNEELMTEELDTIELLGREFLVAPSIGLMALMKFAHFAKSGARTDDMGAMDAMYNVLRSVIADEDWEPFQEHAIEVRADLDELLACIRTSIAVMSARPTKSPGGSRSGRQNTGTNSSVALSSTDSSTPDDGTSWTIYTGEDSASPLLQDPRVLELLPLREAARRV